MSGRILRTLALVAGAGAALSAAERINHAGRVLGSAPVVASGTPLQFNTSAADAVVGAMQIMPRSSAWNEDISRRPVHADSAAIMTQIQADLSPSRQTLYVFSEMNYVLAPDDQPLVQMRFTEYPDDSDFNGGTNPVATWPIPAIMPIESWPSGRPDGETLADWQRDTAGDGGDRHSIIVQPGAGRLFETWQARLTTNTPAWEASNGAIFALTTNTLRTDGWTSGDAAGLPLFPALIRYDECQRGEIEHALRIVVRRSRQAYIYPATHYASSLTDAAYPAMGQRVRLKAGFTIPDGWTRESKAVAKALKRYGALVADNGGFFSVSACPDDRFPEGCFADVQTIGIGQFEVIQTTGPTEGPRSPGAPTADAGPDQTVALSAGATLAGGSTGTGTTLFWTLYDSTAAGSTAAFQNSAQADSRVSLSTPGVYRLRLQVADGVHTPAYDIVQITVTADGGTPPEIVPETPGSPTGQNDDGGGSGGCGAASGLALLLALASAAFTRRG